MSVPLSGAGAFLTASALSDVCAWHNRPKSNTGLDPEAFATLLSAIPASAFGYRHAPVRLHVWYGNLW